MRLQTKEIEIIRKVAREIYGEGVRVYLFGSRLDDTKRAVISICLFAQQLPNGEYWNVFE